MLTLLLTTLVLSAQSSSNVNASNNIAPDADAAETALACGLSLDHEDVYCGNSESGVITVNLSTNEVGDFTLNWTTDATPIPSSTVTITAGQIDGDTGLFQGDVVTIEGLTPGVYNLTVTTPDGLTCFAQATIFVTDFQAPIITCPLPIVANAPIGACEITIDVSNLAIATDSCGVIIESDIQEVTAGVGVTNFPVTYTATDGSGNVTTATCDIEVTVRDEEGPTIQCPTSISVDTDDSECGAVVEWGVTAEDNCPGVVVTTMCIFPDTTDPVACMSGMEYPIGTTLVLGTATDASGNQANCAFEIMVADGEPPVVDCPTDITVSNDAGECGAIVNFAPTATDNCGIVSNSTDIASGTFFELGTTTVTYTATDAAGNSTTCDFTVTVVDNEDPILVCPADATINTSSNGAGDCAAAVPNFIPDLTAGTNGSFSGNCSATVTQSPAPGTLWGAAHGDTQAVIITVTDVNGNTATCEVTLTLQDDERPTLTCPVAAISVGNTDGLCSAVVNFNVSANDNCTVALAGSHASGDTFPLGTTTVTYTATDAAGNTRSCSFNVSVRDNEEPNVSCPSNIEIDNDPGECGAIATYNTSFTDNCPGGTDMISHVSGSFFPVGTTTITYSALDASGLNGAICTFDVVVNDNEPPTVDPQDVTMQTGDNDVYDCIVTVPNYEDPIVDGAPNPLYNAADNCSITVTQDPAPGTPFEDGGVCAEPIVVTITATDGVSTVTETATVTLEDNVDPLITCPADITALDGCDGAEVTIPVPVFVEPILDASGNAITPTNPADPATGAYTDDCDCVVLSGPTTDNGVVLDASNTATFPLGVTTLTYTATDAAGNTATCTFTVTVDTPASVIVCNGSDEASATYDANENCEALHTWPSPTIEACDSSTPIPATCLYPDGTSASCASGDAFPLGTTDVTFAGADQCNFTVTVEDTPPTFDADPAVIPTSDNGVYDCGVEVPNYIDATLADGSANPFWINLEDNCGAVATQDPAPGTVFGTCHEDTQDVVINIFDDNNGDGVADNTTVVDTETVTITLIDDVDPLIACPANVVLNTSECEGVDYTALPFNLVEETLDADGNPLPLDPYTYADDCSTAAGCLEFELVDSEGVTLADGDSGTGTFPPGTTTLTYTVTDGAGNTATCSYTVTVIVEEMFTLNCPSNVKVPNDLGECGADVYWNPPIVTGSCTGDSGGSAPATSCVYPDGTTGPCGIGSFFPVGITVVTYEGVMPACSFEVRVLDTEKPIIECPEDITVSVAGPSCKAWVSWNKPTPSDNCGVVSMNGTHINTGMYFLVGTTTVIYKAADAAGNTGTCNFTITVIDNLDPAASCPDDITLAAPGTATWTPPNPVDNCVADGVLIQATHEPGAFFDETTTVTYMFEDAAGNIDECSFTVNVGAGASPIVAGRVAMEGASMNGGGMMRDDLRMSPLMPNSFGLVTPYGGSSATSTIMLSGASNTNSAVDWILIEIRDANNPAQVLMTRSALVQRDGDIMAADGSSSVTLAGLSNGNYHVAVRHRNHLGVMTATPVYLDANAPMLDFTDANFQTWGTNARVNVNGKMVMIAGDATGDGAVTAADRSDIWNNRNTQSYMTQDCDMNGATTAADRNISYNNRNTIEQLPQ